MIRQFFNVSDPKAESFLVTMRGDIIGDGEILASELPTHGTELQVGWYELLSDSIRFVGTELNDND
jgi:hypothetical protein